jgi:hypothetical protein
LHPASGLLILGLDWLLFSGSMVTLGLSTLASAGLGFGVASLGTGLIQRRYGGDGLGGTLLKGLLAGTAVGLPLPIAGTAVGGGILALSGLDRLGRRADPDKMSPPSSLSNDDQ